MKTIIASLLFGGSVLLLIAWSPAGPYYDSHSVVDTSDVVIRIQKASTEQQLNHASVEIERSHDSTVTYWVGQTVMTVSTSDIDSVTVLGNGRMSPRTETPLVVHVKPDVGREYTSVTEEAVHKHLAFRLLGEVVAAPRIEEPLLGGRIVLYGVQDSLHAAFVEKVRSQTKKD